MAFVSVVVAWLIAAIALVTGEKALFVVAAPFLLIPGAVSLMRAGAWSSLVRPPLHARIYGPDYRDRIVSSRAVRLGTSAALVCVGLIWLVLGMAL